MAPQGKKTHLSALSDVRRTYLKSRSGSTTLEILSKVAPAGAKTSTSIHGNKLVAKIESNAEIHIFLLTLFMNFDYF